jgi:hypothetical protein
MEHYLKANLHNHTDGLKHEELLVKLCGVPRNVVRLLDRIRKALDTIDNTPSFFNLPNDEWDEIVACIEKTGKWCGYLSATTYTHNPRKHKLIVAEFFINKNAATVLGTPILIPVTYAADLPVKQMVYSVMCIIGGQHEAVADFIRSQGIKTLHIS